MIDVERWPALPITAGVVFVAAAAGDQVGYLMGRCVGPGLFQRPHSRLFNPTNVTRAQVFFERRGPSAVVIARFIPVVRAFTPIVAGIGNMRYRTFLAYNLFGAALYAAVVILSSHSHRSRSSSCVTGAPSCRSSCWHVSRITSCRDSSGGPIPRHRLA